MISQAHFQTYTPYLLSAFVNQNSEMIPRYYFTLSCGQVKEENYLKIAQNLDQLHRLVRTQTLLHVLHPSLYLEHLYIE